MIVYEVNLLVNRSIIKPYVQWLSGHINEMLEIEGFLDADCFSVIDPAKQSQAEYSVRYSVESEAALDHYMTHHAGRMRQQAKDLFAGQFTASRRVLSMIK